jgi:hypothetical protein
MKSSLGEPHPVAALAVSNGERGLPYLQPMWLALQK